MASVVKGSSIKRLITIIFSATLVAVLGGVANYFVTIYTQQAPKLHYALSPLASFPSDKEAFSIQELRVTNVGDEKETNIIVNISTESEIADFVTQGAEKPTRSTISDNKRHLALEYERLPPQMDLFISLKLNGVRGIAEQNLEIYGDHGPASVKKIEPSYLWWQGFWVGWVLVGAICAIFQTISYYYSSKSLRQSEKNLKELEKQINELVAKIR